MKWSIKRINWVGGKDLDAEATSFTYTVPTYAGYLTGITGRVIAAFSGITGPVTISVGYTGNTEALIMASDLSVVGEFLGPGHLPEAGGKFFCTRREFIYEMEDILVTFTSSSGDLDGINAGEVEIVMFWVIPE